MSDNVYCKREFEVGDTAYYYSSQTQLTTDGQTYKYYQDISYTITSDTKKLCMYLLEDDRTPSGYTIHSAFTNYVGGEYHFVKNGDYMYPMGTIPITSDSVLPNCYSIPDSLGRYIISESAFSTNIPIFRSLEDAQDYISGDLDISNAINYNKVFKNDSWTEYVEEPSKCVALLMEKHLLLARRRLLMSMMQEIIIPPDNGGGGNNPSAEIYLTGLPLSDEYLYVAKLIYMKNDIKYINITYIPSSSSDLNYIYLLMSSANYTPSKKTLCFNYEFNDGIGGYAVQSLSKICCGKLNDDGTIDEEGAYSDEFFIPLIYTYEAFTTDGCTEISFETNIPIFESTQQANKYLKGNIGIEEAINYNKVWRNDEWVQV